MASAAAAKAARSRAAAAPSMALWSTLSVAKKARPDSQRPRVVGHHAGAARPTVRRLVWPRAMMPVNWSTPKEPRFERVDGGDAPRSFWAQTSGPGSFHRRSPRFGQSRGVSPEHVVDDRDDYAVVGGHRKPNVVGTAVADTRASPAASARRSMIGQGRLRPRSRPCARGPGWRASARHRPPG